MCIFLSFSRGLGLSGFGEVSDFLTLLVFFSLKWLKRFTLRPVCGLAEFQKQEEDRTSAPLHCHTSLREKEGN